MNQPCVDAPLVNRRSPQVQVQKYWRTIHSLRSTRTKAYSKWESMNEISYTIYFNASQTSILKINNINNKTIIACVDCATNTVVHYCTFGLQVFAAQTTFIIIFPYRAPNLC
jgi:hypothetical protein